MGSELKNQDFQAWLVQGSPEAADRYQGPKVLQVWQSLVKTQVFREAMEKD